MYILWAIIIGLLYFGVLKLNRWRWTRKTTPLHKRLSDTQDKLQEERLSSGNRGDQAIFQQAEWAWSMAHRYWLKIACNLYAGHFDEMKADLSSCDEHLNTCLQELAAFRKSYGQRA